MKIKGVLIDLDGTLLDTVPDLAAACNAMLNELGKASLKSQTIADYVGKGAEVLVHRCLTNSLTGIAPKDDLEAAMLLFSKHYEQSNGVHARLYDGVIEGLDAMKSAGLTLACVTNKPQRFAEPLLRAVGLSHYFEFVQGGDVLEHKKPHPLPMQWAASRLSIPVHQCAAIGDSMNDAAAARQAGMKVLMVPYGYNEGKPVSAADCDHLVASLVQAASILAISDAALTRAILLK
jgi:phosphoglycolate phosphatase